ncbi:ribonucleotide reductase [Muromegalovirus G4]|uniref:Ribonucleoside-diphosphate reductase large subunit-like protein n=1 Tax=Muromegalovirus G4 TaxID=524650 RepID=B3UX00_MUHV1|nr:ribonucleotide reductase [Muromegalovirus G4]QNL29194.1 ribonucleotide reductase [Muromegalovirus G4]
MDRQPKVYSDPDNGFFFLDVPMPDDGQGGQQTATTAAGGAFGVGGGHSVPYVRIMNGVSGIQIGNHNAMSIASCWSPSYTDRRRRSYPKTATNAAADRVAAAVSAANAAVNAAAAAAAAGGGGGANLLAAAVTCANQRGCCGGNGGHSLPPTRAPKTNATAAAAPAVAGASNTKSDNNHANAASGTGSAAATPAATTPAAAAVENRRPSPSPSTASTAPCGEGSSPRHHRPSHVSVGTQATPSTPIPIPAPRCSTGQQQQQQQPQAKKLKPAKADPLLYAATMPPPASVTTAAAAAVAPESESSPAASAPPAAAMATGGDDEDQSSFSFVSDDVLGEFEDLRIAGLPVRDEMRPPTPTMTVIPVSRPFRAGRDSGRDALFDDAVESVRCYCHGILGNSRFCALVNEKCSEPAKERMARIRRYAADVTRCGPLALYTAIVSSANRLIQTDPSCDLDLAECYVETASKRNAVPLSAFYRDCDRLRDAVAAFFKTYGMVVDAMAQRITERVGPALGRGLYSTVVMMDRCGNSFQGREETPISVFARVAAALAVECEVDGGASYKILSSKPVDAAQAFDAFLSALCSFAIIPSPRVLAYAGFGGSNPIFDAVSYRAQFYSAESTINGTLHDICDMVTNGLSVSVSAADLGGDIVASLHILGQQCKALRPYARFKTVLRIYFDIWSVDALKIFSFILDVGREYEGLISFAVNTPRIFWDRYLDSSGDKMWLMFARREAAALCGLDLKSFRNVYEKMERDGRSAITVSPWWAVCQLDACVARGNTAVVFPHNVKSMIPENIGRPAVCGPGVSVVSGGFVGCTPIHELCINLENCVLEGAAVESSVDVVLGLGCRFSFKALESLVRDAVVLGNLLIDMTVRTNAYGAGKLLTLYRDLHIGVVGFHAVVNRLGQKFADMESYDLNQRIAEFIYYTAVRASVDLCMAGADPFPKFPKSLYAAGRFYPDLFDDDERGPRRMTKEFLEKLREDVVKHGIRNASFITGCSADEAANLAGTTPGFWPRRDNVFLEQTPLMMTPTKDQMLDECVRSVKIEPHRLHEEDLSCLGENRPVELPVLNSRLRQISKESATVAVRRGRSAPFYDDSDDEDEVACSETGWTVSTDAVIKMCVDRQPFVDHAQSLPVAIGFGGSSVELARHLRRGNALGLSVGVYKCSMPPSVNYR